MSNDKNLQEIKKEEQKESQDNVVLGNELVVNFDLSSEGWKELEDYSKKMIQDLKKGYWYCISCVGGREKKVEEELKKGLVYGDHDEVQQILICYYKRELIAKNTKKKITRIMNALPGSIFIKMQMTKEIHTLIRRLENVICFVGEQKKTNLQPEVIQPKEIDRLILKYQSEAEVEKTKKIEVDFKVGDFVEIINGVLEGYNGEVLLIEKDSVKVAITMLGRKVESMIPIVNVKSIN